MSAPVLLAFARRPSALSYTLRAMLPVARHTDAIPSIRARWSGHRPDPEQLRAYLRLSDLPEGEHLPLLYPHTFGFRLSMAILTHPRFPVPIWGVLQVRNHLLQHRPIERDAVMDFATDWIARRVTDKGLELDLHTTVTSGGTLCWESLVTFFARGRFGAATARLAPPAPPEDFGPEIGAFEMADDAYLQFGAFTGDYNGIHAWDAYARLFGFRRALYHPPRVLGPCLARLPPLATGGAERLDVWLKGPVPHGARVRLHARLDAAEGSVPFALFAGDRPSFVGLRRSVRGGSRLVPGGD